MATLDSLKRALSLKTASFPREPLSDTQYCAGFDVLVRGSGRMIYQDFIIPELCQLLAPLFISRPGVSVLEVGPGPKSVLGLLPSHLKRKIRRYAAFEPNKMFAAMLEDSCRPDCDTESTFPGLESSPEIYQTSFSPDVDFGSQSSTSLSNGQEKFDMVLFCHSMYGMKPKQAFIRRALELLVTRPEGGLVVVFHRDQNLRFDGLACHRTASFPTGIISVPNEDKTLDLFAPFIAGFDIPNPGQNMATRTEWREVCRALGSTCKVQPNDLIFSSPDVMVAFNQHATKLPELMVQVPTVKEGRTIKNPEARLQFPASIVKPTDVRDVQYCVQWAQKHGLSLTVLAGTHSGQCVKHSVISIDMSAFERVEILAAQDKGEFCSDASTLVVAETGCKIGDIVRKTMAEGIMVPLGARPSVGAGLWLQGGIGHLARLHGLTCDAIVGAVLVSVNSGEVHCIGHVPSQHCPAGAVRPENEDDLLWAIKGAGTNFGIVISVAFKAYPAPTYLTHNWTLPLSNNIEAQRRISELDQLVAKKLPVDASMDLYLYSDTDRPVLGVTLFESSTTKFDRATATPMSVRIGAIMGPANTSSVVDGVGLFDTEMYVSDLHGGHGGGKTSSFKRCSFLKGIGATAVVGILLAAIETRPSPHCYLHLLQGGGAVANVAPNATAFGCRDWDFACVVTGVWARDLDGSDAARATVQWVYGVMENLMPFSSGVYGADLGPDPRDSSLAARAFGPNRPRLARLKHSCDPQNLLAYACPLPKTARAPKLIIAVTGDSGVGKDFSAAVWVTAFARRGFTARAVSISDATKREYAAATGADLDRLLQDRAYKEHHRSALLEFYQHQVQQRPGLPEDHFLQVVQSSPDVDVLLVTGMRDEAPVATFTHLVPSSRLLELRVRASEETRRTRCGRGHDDDGNCDTERQDHEDGKAHLTAMDFGADLTFPNDTSGTEAAEKFADTYLLPFFQESFQRLADMVRSVPDFPRAGVEFRDVLGISQQPGGLSLCTSLLQTHFIGEWAKVDVVACCEAGGFVYGSALAARADVDLVLIREGGKLCPPTVSVTKSLSHISSLAPTVSKEKSIEMSRDLVSRDTSVVVVDDVFATGKTLCAMLRLLTEAGVSANNVKVMVVAEFPVHRGRELLRQNGFGTVTIQSLLVFGGV